MALDILLIQFLGLIAALTGVGAYIFKDHKLINLFLSLSGILFSVQYAFLGLASASVIQAINGLRGVLLNASSSKSSLIFLLVLYWLAGLFFYQNYIDIAPLIAVSIGTFAMSQLKGVLFRLFMLIPSTIWFSIGLYANSYGAMALSFVAFTINLFQLLSELREQHLLLEKHFSKKKSL